MRKGETSEASIASSAVPSPKSKTPISTSGKLLQKAKQKSRQQKPVGTQSDRAAVMDTSESDQTPAYSAGRGISRVRVSLPCVTIQRCAVSTESLHVPVHLHLGPMPLPPVHQHLGPKPASPSLSQPAAVSTASPRIHLAPSLAQTHSACEFSSSSGSESVQEVWSMAQSDVFTTTTGGIEQQTRRDSMQQQVHVSQGIRVQHYARGMAPPSQQCV